MSKKSKTTELVFDANSVVKPKFRTQWNRSSFAVSKGEVNTLPTITRPNMALTIKEVLSRKAAGLPVTGSRVPIYEDQDDEKGLPTIGHELYTDWEKLDWFDKLEATEAMKQHIDEINNKRRHAEMKYKQQQKELQQSMKEFRDAQEKLKAHAEQYPIKTPPEGPPVGPPEAKSTNKP